MSLHDILTAYGLAPLWMNVILEHLPLAHKVACAAVACYPSEQLLQRIAEYDLS